MARRSRRMFTPGLDPAAYSLQGLKSIDMKTLQHEYARIREEARDRLRGFARSREWSTHSKTYMQNKDRFPSLRDIKSDRGSLEHKIIEGIRFVTSKGSSVSGAKEIQEDIIQSFHESGYDWVDKKNIWEVTDFLDWARDNKMDRTFGSGTMLDIFNWAQDNEISPEDLQTSFEAYAEQYEYERAEG